MAECKNLVFTDLLVQGSPGQAPVKTWMLLPFGNSPLLQAMWSPPMKTLICQWTYSSKGPEEFEKKNKVGKASGTETRMVDKRFMINISDESAIEAILNNFVVNYDGQDWRYEMPLDPRTDQLSTVDQELEKMV